MTGTGAPPGDPASLTTEHLVAAFRRGEIIGPRGPLVASAAQVTARSVLLMTAGTVLKLRRPRRVLGLDMTTRTLRTWAAEQETWIGRRVSPGLYLEDVSLRFDEDGFALVPGLLRGEPAVAMTRLDEETRADALMAEAADVERLRPALERIAAFHEEAPIHRDYDGWGAPGRMRERWREALAALPSEGDEAPFAIAGRIAVDTGAVYGGPLTAARIDPEGDVTFLSV